MIYESTKPSKQNAKTGHLVVLTYEMSELMRGGLFEQGLLGK